MAWVFFIVASLFIALAFQTHSLGLAAVSLIAAFGLMLAGAFKMAAARIATRTQNAASLIGPEELALMRRAREAAPKQQAPAAEEAADSVAQDQQEGPRV